MRTNPYAELTNRDSAIVADALTRRCECGAKVGEDCRSVIKGQTVLPGRLVHLARATTE